MTTCASCSTTRQRENCNRSSPATRALYDFDLAAHLAHEKEVGPTVAELRNRLTELPDNPTRRYSSSGLNRRRDVRQEFSRIGHDP